MTRLIRTELLKQRTLRTFWVAVVAVPLLAGLITAVAFGAAGRQGNDPLGPDNLLQSIGAPASVITVIALLLGVLGMTGEYRYQTITTTFLATPRRRDVMLSKLGAHGLIGAGLGVLSLVGSMVVAVPWLSTSDVAVRFDGDALRVAAGLATSAGLYGALGVAVGALIRNQMAATATVLVWLLAVESLTANLFRGAAFVRWLPVAAASDIVHPALPSEGLTAAVAVAVFAGYVVALAVLATGLTLRRDVT